MEKEELLKEKVNALNTSEGVKEQIGQLHKDKELLETEKRSLVDEKKDLEEKYSKVTDEVSNSASKVRRSTILQSGSRAYLDKELRGAEDAGFYMNCFRMS